MRWATRYGLFLGSFRLLSCCNETLLGVKRSSETLAVAAGAGGVLAAAVAPGFGAAPLGASFVPASLPPRALAVAAAGVGCSGLIYAAAEVAVAACK